MRRCRRGQATVEYLFLLCMAMTAAVAAGSFLSRYGRQLVDQMADLLLRSIVTLSLP